MTLYADMNERTVAERVRASIERSYGLPLAPWYAGAIGGPGDFDTVRNRASEARHGGREYTRRFATGDGCTRAERDRAVVYIARYRAAGRTVR